MMAMRVFHGTARAAAIGAAAALAGYTATAEAALISGVSVSGTDAADHLLVPGGLAEEADVFVDRDNDAWLNVPAFLVGADYISPANNNRTVADFSLTFTLEQDATVFLLLDIRGAEEAVAGWRDPLGFSDTGVEMNIAGQFGTDEMAIWSADLSAGVYTFGTQNAGTINMYTVAATPEPASLALLGLGGAAAMLRRR